MKRKVWKTVRASGSVLMLTEALQAIEDKMRGTVFVVFPSKETKVIGDHGRPNTEIPIWDIIYYVEVEA
jgi:hypothetical protein